MVSALALLNESGRQLVAHLWQMSLELTILAGIVLVALHVLRVKSPVLRHLFWSLLLAKPLVMFLVASPLTLYGLLLPPMESISLTEALPPIQKETLPSQPPAQILSMPDVSPSSETPQPEAPPLWRQIDRYGLVFAMWAFMAAILGSRLLVGCAYVACLRRTASTQRKGILADLLTEAGKLLHTHRRLRIATTGICHGPVLAGIFRPLILLPDSMAKALTPNQLKLIITHELAHARRWDNLVLLIQRCAETLFFFHPVVWFCGWIMPPVRRRLPATTLCCRPAAIWMVRVQRHMPTA